MSHTQRDAGRRRPCVVAKKSRATLKTAADRPTHRRSARPPPMLYILLLVAAAIIGFICQARRHFGRQIPAYRVDEVIGKLQVRRYPTLPVAEIRVSGSSAIVALHAGTKLLNRYFREHQISRFALPLFAEKVDAADAVWTMSAVLPMPLSAAPAPRNKAIQLREVPPQRVFARRYHGSVSADERLTQHKAELLPEVNDACRRLGCTKLSTVVVMHATSTAGDGLKLRWVND